jgi:hypothetical protein
MGRATLRLHTLATQIIVCAREIFLAVLAEVLLFVPEPIGSLLSAMIALGSINTGFLACSRTYPLRHQFLWKHQHQNEEHAGKDIFRNYLDNLAKLLTPNQYLRAKLRNSTPTSKVFHIQCG